MSAIGEIILAVWILWAALFVLGLSAAAARPIPHPAPVWVYSSRRLPGSSSRHRFAVETHAHTQFK